MINIEKLKKYFKTQREIYDYKGKGICFPIALYNIFPKIYKNENDLKKVCKDFDKKDRDLDECINYFNTKLKLDKLNETLILDRIDISKYSLEQFLTYLDEHSNNLMILVYFSKHNSTQGHVVSYLGIENKNIAYFENNDENLIDMCSKGFMITLLNKTNTPFNNNLIQYTKKNKIQLINWEIIKSFFKETYINIGENFSEINPEFLYYGSSDNIYFIRLKNEKESILTNYSSRLTILQIPKGLKLNYNSDDICDITIDVSDIVS